MKYYCYSCGCFSDPPCRLISDGEIHTPNSCPFGGSPASWEQEGQEIKFERCFECGSPETTYKTEAGIIYFNCPKCGQTSQIDDFREVNDERDKV